MMRLLVAEDHPILGYDLKKGLEQCHYAVDLVIDGTDALAWAETEPYDLIILDILLPGLDGWEICRQLRAKERMMPILFHWRVTPGMAPSRRQTARKSSGTARLSPHRARRSRCFKSDSL
ncbi:MAG TPA: response regulator [Ktedonobacteraceae bacterium]|nr:response regulator [Ktedonobacteraceae bacterium]